MGVGETHYFWIYCDVDRCSNSTEEPSFSAAGNEGEAEQRALGDGWTCEDGEWRCPDHSKKNTRRKSR